MQIELPILLENVELETRIRMWFQQDGAPAHRSQLIQNYLNNRFPNRWIGNRTHEWPPRSPDLTPLDFFVGLCKRKSLCNRTNWCRRYERMYS